ncbi:hypothetical protein DFJ77DRAFT_303461 [Powellomyces hirtus]|nr:hypothetical protein DFJ77DRAFT_303461 [Powellomyces hirtus]
MRRPLHTPSSLKNQHLPQTIPQKSTTKSSPARCLPTSLPTPKRAFKPLIGHPVEPAVSEPRADSRTISNYWINPPAPFQVAEFSTCMTQLPRTDDYPFVHVLALVLSRTDYQTLGKCERVSKLWMTAASKSWILLLEKDFGGPDASDRVEVASYADPKTHKVLYRFRYVQYFANLKHHCSSFIGRLYIRSLGCAPTAVLRAPYMCGIHLDLMKGSNSEKLRIARRFWIALFLREAQRYRDHDLVWGLPSVRNVELLTSDMSRVWTAPACIRLGSSDSEFVRPASYLVCTQTGDILTWLDPGTPGLPEPWQWLVDVCHARIGHSTTSDTLPHASAFLSLVLTKDTDFPQDIHRSVPRTGYHDLVAFRTVLAHCEDIDPSLTAGYERKAPTPRLITHEFRGAVQSIHFHSAPGRQRRQRHEVCADLALVHTVDRGTLYVLVETGHSIGDEQGGISPLWQNILQCDQDACGSLDTDDPADAMWATVGPHAMHIAQTYLRNTTAEPITHTSLMSGPVADYYAARSMEEVCRE